MHIINPAGLPPARGYSHGLVAEGRLLFVAGQVGWTHDATLVGEGFADQFDQALANVLAVVTEAGGRPESIARLTIFVADRTEYLAAQREIGLRYRARMGRHYPPMTLVEVRALLEPGAKVEIEATAVLAEARS